MINSTLRALIVDDDPTARERLRFLLAEHPEINVAGEASSVATAMALCRDLHPNLIFLDVDMPGGNGFSLLEKLDPLPSVIFVTAYDAFAVRAFEVNAVDYLLKPISPRRLADAIQRLIHEPPRTQTIPYRTTDRVFLPHGRGYRIVFISDICGIEARENYTEVLLVDGTHVLMRRPLLEWDQRLPKSLFFSPHRSLIVNLKAVHNVVLESRARLSFKLQGRDRAFVMGQRPAARLRRALRLASE